MRVCALPFLLDAPVHQNGFGHFDIEGSNDATVWTDGDYDSSDTYTPQVLQGTWVTVAANLMSNGYGSGAR